MEIFPAIDLKDGRCVRLTQGDFATATIYNADPAKQALQFAESGATWLHMVDLDGARVGELQQFNTIAHVARHMPLKLQVGGGIRKEATVEKLLGAGVSRVVIGSLAVKEPALVQSWLRTFGPQSIVLAFDVSLKEGSDPEILTHGWQSGSQQSLWDVLKSYADSGLETVLCTDIGRDGMLGGTNHALYKSMQERWPKLNVLASGGVSGLADLMKLAKLGVAGAIVGKAIYEGRVDLAAAIKQVKRAG
jgi:phosphoribosylformimino-5-aminoimidazole carboxamide ribotide isomerase